MSPAGIVQKLKERRGIIVKKYKGIFFFFITSLILYFILNSGGWFIDLNQSSRIILFGNVYFFILLTLLIPRRFLTPLNYFIISFVLAFSLGTTILSRALSGHPDIQMIFILILEFVVVACLVISTYWIITKMKMFDESVHLKTEKVSNDPSLDITEAESIIQMEITRSRHFERPLSVVLLDYSDLINSDPSLVETTFSQEKLTEKNHKLILANLIKEEIPPSSVLIKDKQKSRFILVFPEVSERDVHSLIRHLDTTISRHFIPRVNFSSASFPVDAINFQALYNHALEKLEDLITQQKIDESNIIRAKVEEGEAVYAHKP